MDILQKSIGSEGNDTVECYLFMRYGQAVHTVSQDQYETASVWVEEPEMVGPKPEWSMGSDYHLKLICPAQLSPYLLSLSPKRAGSAAMRGCNCFNRSEIFCFLGCYSGTFLGFNSNVGKECDIFTCRRAVVFFCLAGTLWLEDCSQWSMQDFDLWS